MGARVDQHLAFVKKCAAGHSPDPSYLIGYRSALFDAAHLVDIVRTELAAAGRPSVARQDKELLLTMIGDAIWDMKDLLPPPPTPGTAP